MLRFRLSLTGRMLLLATTVLLVTWLPASVVAADVAPPQGIISTPQPNQVFGQTPVLIVGSATDDESVTAVRVAIRDRDSLEWWRGNGSWGSFIWLNATLTTPGATSTTWSYSFPGDPGSYAVFVMENGAPKLRVVEVGLMDFTYAQILSGLEAGDVVTTGIVETE